MIELQYADHMSDAPALKRLLSRARVQRWVAQALRQPHPADQITLRVVDEAEGLSLNRSYRSNSKKTATNVLTFDYQQTPCLVADLVLCAPVIAREAAQQGKAMEAHWAHLIVHGILHAQGYDHETNERDALVMESLEVLIVQSLGYPNPY